MKNNEAKTLILKQAKEIYENNYLFINCFIGLPILWAANYEILKIYSPDTFILAIGKKIIALQQRGFRKAQKEKKAHIEKMLFLYPELALTKK